MILGSRDGSRGFRAGAPSYERMPRGRLEFRPNRRVCSNEDHLGNAKGGFSLVPRGEGGPVHCVISDSLGRHETVVGRTWELACELQRIKPRLKRPFPRASKRLPTPAGDLLARQERVPPLRHHVLDDGPGEYQRLGHFVVYQVRFRLQEPRQLRCIRFRCKRLSRPKTDRQFRIGKPGLRE
jgi:hypothetical protein